MISHAGPWFYMQNMIFHDNHHIHDILFPRRTKILHADHGFQENYDFHASHGFHEKPWFPMQVMACMWSHDFSWKSWLSNPIIFNNRKIIKISKIIFRALCAIVSALTDICGKSCYRTPRITFWKYNFVWKSDFFLIISKYFVID